MIGVSAAIFGEPVVMVADRSTLVIFHSRILLATAWQDENQDFILSSIMLMVVPFSSSLSR